MKNTLVVFVVLVTTLGFFTSTGIVAQTTSNPVTSETGTLLSGSARLYDDGLRKWTPHDSVALKYFVSDEADVSPDGQHFFIVSYNGDLSCDCNNKQLFVFRVKDVLQALAGQGRGQVLPATPLRTLTPKSPPQMVGSLNMPRWEPDGQSISFEGLDERGNSQLYLFNIGSGAVTALTKWEYDTYNYMLREGDTIISELRVPSPPSPPPVYPVHVVTRNDLFSALAGGVSLRRNATHVSYRGGLPWSLADSIGDPHFMPAFSVDGRRAIAVRRPNVVPANWRTYDQLSGSTSELRKIGPLQFFLIDAERARSEALFNAPTGEGTKVGSEAAVRGMRPQTLWAADQRNVVLVNTALPLTQGESAERTRMAYVVAYDIENGKWEIIEPLELRDKAGGTLRRVTQVGWLKPGKELLIGHESGGKPTTGAVYTLVDGKWIGCEVDAAIKLTKPEPRKRRALADGLTVRLKQSMNDPPTMVASDGENEIALTHPDPALQGLWWARQEQFQWQESSGKTVAAGLLLPRERKGPVPLVIQTYTYEPNAFTPDGPAKHAYAGQSLVARGMAVLNIDLPSEAGSPAELTAFADRINAAADALASRGLIDRSRVGLIGFSRAGYETFYAITHPNKVPPAAAVIDDAFSGTYAYYLFMNALGSGMVQDFERVHEGSFWKNKAAWIEREPSFNIDRVETPAIFTLHNQTSLLTALDIIGSFSRNRRPLEFLLFPNGGHELSLPRQRFASQEATVDWMSFWLQGVVPADKERAARWLNLRAQQETVLKEAVAKGQKRAPLPPLVPARPSTTAAKQN